jgi:hypothetical protein
MTTDKTIKMNSLTILVLERVAGNTKIDRVFFYIPFWFGREL